MAAAAASSPTTAIAGLLHVHSSRYVWSTLAISAEGSNAPPLTLEPSLDSKVPSASAFTLEPVPIDPALDATPSPLLTFRDSAGHYIASVDGVALSIVPFYSASSCAWRLVDDHYLQCASSDSFLACSIDHGVTLSRTRDDAHCRFLLCPPRMEGWLQKKASSGLFHAFQKRWFRFEAGLLSYWHSDTDAKEDAGGHGHTHAKPAGTFLWSNVVSVAQSHASPLRFDVEIKSTDAHGHALAATRKLELQAHDVAEVAAWVAAIRGPHVESVVKAGRLSAAALHPSGTAPSSQIASSSRNNSRRGSLEHSTTSTEHQHLPPKHAAMPQAVAIEEGAGSEVAASAAAAPADAGAMSPTSALVFGVTESPLAAAIKVAEHQEEQKAREAAHSVHADEKLVEAAAQREAEAALALQQEAALHQSIAHTDGVERASVHRSESIKVVDAADAAAEYKAAAEARAQLAGAGGLDSCVSPGTAALEDASRVDQPEAAASHAAAEAATLATREAAEQRRQQQLLQAPQSTPSESQPSVDQHLQDDVAARAAEEQRVAAVAAAVAEEHAKHAAIVQQQHADSFAAGGAALSPSPEATQVEADRQRELERIAAQEKAGAELQAAQEAEMLRVKHQQAEEEQARELQASRDAEAAKVAEAEREEIIRKRLEADEQEAEQAAKEREQRAQAEAEQLAVIAAQQKREAEEAAAAASAAVEAEKVREQKAAEEAVAFAAATAAATAAAAAALESERTAQEQLASAEKRRVEAEAAELAAAAQRRQEEEAAVKQEEDRQRAAKARASRPSTVAAAASAATVAAGAALAAGSAAAPAAVAASAAPAVATSAAVDPPSQVRADTTDVSVNVPSAAVAGESPSSSESPDPTSGAAASAGSISPPLLSADAAAVPSDHSITIAPEDGKCAEPSAHNKADEATTKPGAMSTEESTKEKGAAEGKTPPEKKKCCTIL